ncbi:hypothetical protein WDZ92_40965 [Nostoc sp. NIES-2111]
MSESVIYQMIQSEAEEKGSNKKARQIALNLLAEGISIDLIVRATGLSIEEVQQLQLQSTDS